MAMTMPTAMYAPTSDVMDRHDYGITKSRKSSSTGGGRAWSEDEVRGLHRDKLWGFCESRREGEPWLGLLGFFRGMPFLVSVSVFVCRDCWRWEGWGGPHTCVFAEQ